MRAFAGGYYRNLRAMYDYLGVSYHAQPFVFEFARLLDISAQTEGDTIGPYFIHASNNHILPPIRPSSLSVLEHIVEMIYLLVCYTWYTLYCFVAAPHPSKRGQPSETFEQYLRRIRLPQYFIASYLLPLMSAVTTSSHRAVLQFPAKDLVDYKLKSHGQQHFTVTNGVQKVQEKLARGLDVRLRSSVYSVEPTKEGVKVRWIPKDGISKESEERTFDKVILAVAPDVVGRIFAPLQAPMARIPTISVRSIVSKSSASKPVKRYHALEDKRQRMGSSRAQRIQLLSWFEDEGWTESNHELASGLMVTTCPFAGSVSGQELHSAQFTRVLRTPESRDIVNSILGISEGGAVPTSTAWKNGDDGIFLIGSWVNDGMVLLEGCVFSAMRVANSLGVHVPWTAT